MPPPAAQPPRKRVYRRALSHNCRNLSMNCDTQVTKRSGILFPGVSGRLPWWRSGQFPTPCVYPVLPYHRRLYRLPRARLTQPGVHPVADVRPGYGAHIHDSGRRCRTHRKALRPDSEPALGHISSSGRCLSADGIMDAGPVYTSPSGCLTFITRVQSPKKTAGMTGSFIMGAVSGLVIGPCTALLAVVLELCGNAGECGLRLQPHVRLCCRDGNIPHPSRDICRFPGRHPQVWQMDGPDQPSVRLDPPRYGRVFSDQCRNALGLTK